MFMKFLCRIRANILKISIPYIPIVAFLQKMWRLCIFVSSFRAALCGCFRALSGQKVAILRVHSPQNGVFRPPVAVFHNFSGCLTT